MCAHRNEQYIITARVSNDELVFKVAGIIKLKRAAFRYLEFVVVPAEGSEAAVLGRLDQVVC